MGQNTELTAGAKIISYVVLFVVLLVIAGMWGCPVYNVWQQGLAGEAALKRAEQDRRIAVQEANAKKDAATLLADAEIARAQGVAKANQIIGDSLKENEAYLRYLWVTDVAGKTSTSVVYVPTGGLMPQFLEAGKGPAR
jgi:regulator of protease activity HflC (stomatin/prohibitin superfamily)